MQASITDRRQLQQWPCVSWKNAARGVYHNLSKGLLLTLGPFTKPGIGVISRSLYLDLQQLYYYNIVHINRPTLTYTLLASVQFSRSVVSDSLRPHKPQHTRPLCPSPAPRVYPNPCPLSRRCHLTISSSVIPFSSCPQSFPASGSFQISQLFTSGGQSTGVSASTAVLAMNTQD